MLGTRFNPYIVSHDPITNKEYIKIAQGLRASYCNSKFVWVIMYLSLEDWLPLSRNGWNDKINVGKNIYDSDSRIIYSFKPTQAEKEYYERYVKKGC